MTTKTARVPAFMQAPIESHRLNVQCAFLEGLAGGLVEIQCPQYLLRDDAGNVVHETFPIALLADVADTRTDSDIGRHVLAELRRIAARCSAAADQIEAGLRCNN